MTTREVCIMETDRIIVQSRPSNRKNGSVVCCGFSCCVTANRSFSGKTRRFLGSTDVPLSPRGREQAEAMRFTLRDLPLPHHHRPSSRPPILYLLAQALFTGRNVEALGNPTGNMGKSKFDDVAAAGARTVRGTWTGYLECTPSKGRKHPGRRF
jgi:hypothetical protein